MVPLLLCRGADCAPEPDQKAVRVVAIAALQDVLNTWKETSGLNLQTEVADFKSALRAVAGEKADFALVTGTLTPSDKAMLSSQPGSMALTLQVGWESLWLLVHPSNRIPTISLPAARSLFAASSCVTSASPLLAWGDLPGCTGAICSTLIEVYMPMPGSTEEEALKNLLLGDCQPRTDSQILTTAAMVERNVTSHPGAVGVVSRLRFIPGARLLPVALDEGNKDTKGGKQASLRKPHPLSREITLVSRRRYQRGTPQAAFSQYVLSRPGQADLKRLGLLTMVKD